MIAASEPVQRPAAARLMVIDRAGGITHVPRASLDRFLRAGDLVVANDATALPASLPGVHVRTGNEVEVRLAARRSLEEVCDFTAVIFGAGDFRLRTEDRPAPPPLAEGDQIAAGPLMVTIRRVLSHPRLAEVHLEGSEDAIWAGLARHGRLIQYAYLPSALQFWDTWSPLSGRPVAFEPPSAGFALDWQTVERIRTRGAGLATLTHTAA